MCASRTLPPCLGWSQTSDPLDVRLFKKTCQVVICLRRYAQKIDVLQTCQGKKKIDLYLIYPNLNVLLSKCRQAMKVQADLVARSRLQYGLNLLSAKVRTDVARDSWKDLEVVLALEHKPGIFQSRKASTYTSGIRLYAFMRSSIWNDAGYWSQACSVEIEKSFENEAFCVKLQSVYNRCTRLQKRCCVYNYCVFPFLRSWLVQESQPGQPARIRFGPRVNVLKLLWKALDAVKNTNM